MSLDIKAGVLTLISPLMKMDLLYFFSFAYKLFSLPLFMLFLHPLCCIACLAVPLTPQYILFISPNCFLTWVILWAELLLLFDFSTFCFPAPVSNLYVLKRHFKSSNNTCNPVKQFLSTEAAKISTLELFLLPQFDVCIFILQFVPQLCFNLHDYSFGEVFFL